MQEQYLRSKLDLSLIRGPSLPPHIQALVFKVVDDGRQEGHQQAEVVRLVIPHRLHPPPPGEDDIQVPEDIGRMDTRVVGVIFGISFLDAAEEACQADLAQVSPEGSSSHKSAEQQGMGSDESFRGRILKQGWMPHTPSRDQVTFGHDGECQR